MPGEQNAPGGTADGQTAGTQGGAEEASEGLSYETWLKGQPESIQALIEDNQKGLKSALDSERQQRKDIEKKLREAAKKLDEGSESRKALEDMAGKLSGLERQAAFYDAAHAAGVTNLRLAYLAAQESGLLDPDTGKVDFERFKAQFPELFGTAKAPPAHAGTGTQERTAARGMNDFIRTAAGRR